MTSRPYTGNKDAVHSAKREGTKVFVDYCCYLFGVKNLGIFADRDMKGANPPKKSVHATWRAVDLGGNPAQLKALIGFVYDHRDALQIEEIHDYSSAYMANPNGYGAGYRCDRDAFKLWDAKNNGGSKGGKWAHLEISPLFSDHPDLVHAAFKTIFG